MHPRPIDPNGAIFKWLAQPVENLRCKLSDLVEEQHTTMGQRNLPRAQAVRATANQRRCRTRMMWSPKGSSLHEARWRERRTRS